MKALTKSSEFFINQAREVINNAPKSDNDKSLFYSVDTSLYYKHLSGRIYFWNGIAWEPNGNKKVGLTRALKDLKIILNLLN